MLNNNFNPMMNNMNQMMGINPIMGIGMNNMNQSNVMMNMDTTAQNIKNIIEPYENKIRQLEEIIKQKDFEIIVLKQKLNKINNNQNNTMFNVNMMNQMNMMNNINQQSNKEIKVIVQSEDNKFDIVSCFENDTISALRNKITFKGGLTHNYKDISGYSTLKEAGITDGSLIRIKFPLISIHFKTTTGRSTNVVLDPDCAINMAIVLYCMKFDQGQEMLKWIYRNEINCLFNARKIGINDKTPIKILFNLYTNPIVNISI